MTKTTRKVKGKKGGRGSAGKTVLPRALVSSSQMFQKIYERRSYLATATATGVFSGQIVPVAPSSLLSSALLAGYQAVRDDMRIDRVRVSLLPLYHGTTSGRVALYIERHPGQAVSASVDLALGQLELSYGQFNDPLSLEWHPQEPLDREFQPLDPGTLDLADFNVVSDTLSANGTPIALYGSVTTVEIEVWATLRGRSD